MSIDNKKKTISIQVRKKDINTQFMVNNRGFIIHKVNHKKGRRHGYDMYKNNHPVAPKQIVNMFDLGYLGVEKDFPEQLSALPYKKRIHELTAEEEKEYNKFHYKKRIVIESIPSVD